MLPRAYRPPKAGDTPLVLLRAQAGDEWYHCCTPEKSIGSFLEEMSGAVHNVSVDSHSVTEQILMINVCVASLLTDHLQFMSKLVKIVKMNLMKKMLAYQMTPKTC